MSKFESKRSYNTFELGNMSCLFLESHSFRNYHYFPYKLSTYPSAREWIISVKKWCCILIWESESTNMLLVWSWMWWGWDEAGVGGNKLIICCNLPLLLFNKYCCSFSHIYVSICFHLLCNGFLNDIYISHLINLSD